MNRKTEIIGEMQIQDTGFSINCDAATAVGQFKSKACAIGADAIQLYDVRLPSVSRSTWYQAGARFLRYADI